MTPELTVCCSVNTPPARVAAAFAPLRELGPEIVLAVDDRVDPAWVDGYRQIADRVVLVPFPGNFALMYAWMREQCAGRWILQLDLDEVPAPGLAAEVAETIAAGDVTHAWVPRRWLYPDGDRWLAQWPWRPDYALRLLRNDPALLRFPALLHCTVRVLGPSRYLRAPLYHADLLLTDVAGRARKHVEYERELPGFVIDGMSLNEVYYLPERRSDLRLAPVPAQDAAAVRAFLGAGEAAELPAALRRAAPGAVGAATVAEIWRLSEGRTLGADAYDARLVLLDDDLRLVSGEWRTFDVQVHNRGSAHWPGGMDALPQVRLAYRWLGASGEPLEEGARTGLPAPLAPGARAVVPLEVLGPSPAGARTIEIDLVHEGVRWFERGVRAEIEVRAPAGSARATRTSAV
ncbi:MAG TPA: hypothetical protein VNT54_00615 [Solirubrobacteraceae bacterium]|nr:hypothetical protein [Solirubrobacteraceae bacterium]